MPLLHAKQVVFFFIAATVSVVGIFLCGVQVGRGVPLGGGPMTSGLAVAGHSEDHLPPATVSSRRSKLSAAATESAELTYYRRLDRGEPQLERLRSAPNAESPDGAGAANREDAAAPHARGEGVTSPDAVVETATRASMPSEVVRATSVGAQEGFSVQATALQSPASARSVAAQLVAKGYPAAVVAPNSDAPVALFKVWIGPYEASAQAASVMRRLETEEQYRPFITR